MLFQNTVGSRHKGCPDEDLFTGRVSRERFKRLLESLNSADRLGELWKAVANGSYRQYIATRLVEIYVVGLLDETHDQRRNRIVLWLMLRAVPDAFKRLRDVLASAQCCDTPLLIDQRCSVYPHSGSGKVSCDHSLDLWSPDGAR